MRTPEAIKREAADYIEAVPGSKVRYLGKYEDADAYYVAFADGYKVGYPPVFLLKDDHVTEVIGGEALFLIDELHKAKRKKA